LSEYGLNLLLTSTGADECESPLSNPNKSTTFSPHLLSQIIFLFMLVKPWGCPPHPVGRQHL